MLIFRKRTHASLNTKLTGLCPLKLKQNLIHCLLHHAYTIRNSCIGMHKEFDFIQIELRRFLDSKYQIFDFKPRNKNLHEIIVKLHYIGMILHTWKKNFKLFIVAY